jgi:hypothetical protein
MHDMDATPHEEAPRRPGIIEKAKGYIVSVLGATRSKVDDFSAEVEYRTFRILWLTVWALVGITSLWFAVMFAMLTVIFGFHLPPKYAFGIPSLTFLLLGLVAVVMFLKTKHSHRKPRPANSRQG